MIDCVHREYRWICEKEGWDCFSVVVITVGGILVVLIVVVFVLVSWLVLRFFFGFILE